jgi:hypothetical protein
MNHENTYRVTINLIGTKHIKTMVGKSLVDITSEIMRESEDAFYAVTIEKLVETQTLFDVTGTFRTRALKGG